MRLGWFALMGAIALWGQAPRPANLYVSAEQPRLVCGETLPLTAVARDANGGLVTGVAFAWASSDANVFAVSAAGVVTAVRPGVADVIVTGSGLRTTLRLQVLPSRVVVAPAGRELTVGEQQQYTAQVLDKDGKAMDVPVTWSVVGADGNQINAAQMGRTGMLSITGVGRFVVRASVSYTSLGSGQFIPSFIGTAQATGRAPRAYRLRKLASTGDAREGFELRPTNQRISVSANGQVSQIVSLEGYAAGIVMHDGAQLRLMSASGGPGIRHGTVVTSFDTLAMNGRGEMIYGLSHLGTGSYGSHLSLGWAARGESKFLITSGLSDGGVEEIAGLQTARYGLNDNGRGVFRAVSYRAGPRREVRSGLFIADPGGFAELLVGNETALPGQNARPAFDLDFAIDSRENVLFVASADHRALYRRTADSGRVTRVLGVGDTARGERVLNVSSIASSPNGNFAFSAIAQRLHFVTLLRGGGPPEYLPVTNLQGVFGVNDNGDVLFLADVGGGLGLHVWSGQTTRTVAILGRPSPAGEPALNVLAGGIATNGDVIAQLRTSSDPSLVVRYRDGRGTKLFGTGDRVAGRAQLTFSGLVSGARVGPPIFAAGGTWQSLVEAGGPALVLRLSPGDRLPEGGNYPGTYPLRRAPGGEVLVATDDSIHLVTADGARTLARYSLPIESNGLMYSISNVAANSRGEVVSVNYTSLGPRRISLLAPDGQWQALGWIGTGAQRTESPTGGIFTALRDIWVDESGRVIADLRTDRGGGGVMTYANGQWVKLLAIGDRIGARTVTDINNLRVSADRVFTRVSFTGNLSAICEYRDGEWQRLLGSGDDMPSGNTTNQVNGLDANRAGDIVTRMNGAGGEALVVIRSGATEPRVVHLLNELTPAGDYLVYVESMDLRDNGMVYFTALTTEDEYVLYSAEPVN